MGIQEEGIKGEKILFDYIRKKLKLKFFQPDAIFEKDHIYYLAECKHQEVFKPPPFYGHGLPRWQVDARLNFQQYTGIRAVLFIFEKPVEITKKLYWNYLDVLDNGKYYDTKGTKPRRIYPIDRFITEQL